MLGGSRRNQPVPSALRENNCSDGLSLSQITPVVPKWPVKTNRVGQPKLMTRNMKRTLIFHFLLLHLSLWIGIMTTGKVEAQHCSEASLFQKYWQYKNRFNRSFIVQDRDSSGCVNDGIGFSFSPEDPSTCQFTKAGYGLPATNLSISPFGWGVPGDFMNDRFSEDCPFNDHECPGGISFGNGGPNDLNHKFNWIDYGSETLTQLGWLFVTLATEYELLGRSGQVEEQQKVLEEIFLGIQAIRRLDMQTQCMIKQMYDDRSAGEELVCPSEYTDNCHRHWDSKVKSGCNFTPDFSGYNGFFIRSDAGQNLEEFLHDPTDESWNVDAVGGAFSGLNNDPTDACDDVDPFCWMVYTQHIMSHDQLINLFYGFTFIKKYIPANAVVTTCDGVVYKPLEMVQRLSEAIVTNINDNGDHITLPGSFECCEKPVKLSECEGGNLRLTLYGLLKADQYIRGKDTRTTFMQKFGFETTLANSPDHGLSFYLKESSMFKDFSKISGNNRNKIVDVAEDKHKEILLLGNDLLFPGGGESMAEKIGGKEFFKQLLCDAPCEGPCHSNEGFREGWPGEGGRWPEGFDCPNIPGWEGHRWDGEGADVENGSTTAPRRANGLDYMALFNMYMLQYGDGDFYNPRAVQPVNNLNFYNNISGPSILCASQAGFYEIDGLGNNAVIDNISWTPSTNLTITDPNAIATYAFFNAAAPTTGTLNAQFTHIKELPQYYMLNQASPPATVSDECEYFATKKIELTTGLLFKIAEEINPCAGVFSVWAERTNGNGIGSSTFNWTVTHEGDQITGTGNLLYFMDKFIQKYGSKYVHNYGGQYEFQVEIDNGCGQTQTITKLIDIEDCDGNSFKIVRVDPNPANSDIGVSVIARSEEDPLIENAVDLNRQDGYPISIRRTDGGPSLINSRVYANGERVNVSSLSNGYYNLYFEFDTNETLTRTFVIVR